MKPQVLVIVGPTAVGKSKVALELARRLGGEIVSADSMQVYQGMDIGTAKPSRLERRKVTHHLLDIIPPSRSFSVFSYQKRAFAKIRKILRRGKFPIVVGGSGLYVRSLVEGLSPEPGPDKKLRRKLFQAAEKSGSAKLHGRLLRLDPERARKIKPGDTKRIVRALEIFERSGKKPSEWHSQKKESLETQGFEPFVVGLTKDRQRLYADIEKRVDAMFQKGLVREVKKLLKGRLSQTAAQAVGYKELFAALRGSGTLEEARNAIKKKSRHLAKRQMTWFRKEKGIQWVIWEEGDTVKGICEKIQHVIARRHPNKAEAICF